jgi:hypothetical protein
LLLQRFFTFTKITLNSMECYILFSLMLCSIQDMLNSTTSVVVHNIVYHANWGLCIFYTISSKPGVNVTESSDDYYVVVFF